MATTDRQSKHTGPGPARGSATRTKGFFPPSLPRGVRGPPGKKTCGSKKAQEGEPAQVRVQGGPLGKGPPPQPETLRG